MTDSAVKGTQGLQTRHVPDFDGTSRTHRHLELVLSRVVAKLHSGNEGTPTRYIDWESDESERAWH